MYKKTIILTKSMYKIAEICLNKGRLCVEKKGKSDEKNKENIQYFNTNNSYPYISS